MEGGQVVNINLESGLDIKSSDMIVPFSQTTFQHNWQKYQGKCLPNSLRFEHNGWAAGWNVYDFKYNVFTSPQADGKVVKVEPYTAFSFMAGLYEDEDSIEPLNGSQRIVIKDSAILAGEAALSAQDIVGVAMDGGTVALTWDEIRLKFSWSEPNIDVESFINEDKSVDALVRDKDLVFNAQFELELASDLRGKSISAQKYQCMAITDGVEAHGWGGVYELKLGQVPKLKVPEKEEPVDCAVNGNEMSVTYTADINDESIRLNFNNIDYYLSFANLKGAAADGMSEPLLSADADTDLLFNKYKVTVNKPNLLPDDDDNDNRVRLDVDVPIWYFVGLRVKFAREADTSKGVAAVSDSIEPFVMFQGQDVTDDYSFDFTEAIEGVTLSKTHNSALEPIEPSEFGSNNTYVEQVLDKIRAVGGGSSTNADNIWRDFWKFVGEKMSIIFGSTDMNDWPGNAEFFAYFYNPLWNEFAAQNKVGNDKPFGANICVVRAKNPRYSNILDGMRFGYNMTGSAPEPTGVILNEKIRDNGTYNGVSASYKDLCWTTSVGSFSSTSDALLFLGSGASKIRFEFSFGNVGTRFDMIGTGPRTVDLADVLADVRAGETGDKTYIIGSAVPFYGRLSYELTYDRVSTASDIVRKDINSTLHLSRLSNDDLKAELSGLQGNQIYIDRDIPDDELSQYAENSASASILTYVLSGSASDISASTEPFEPGPGKQRVLYTSFHHLFDLEKISAVPDRGDGTGCIYLKLVPTSHPASGLFYAPRKMGVSNVSANGVSVSGTDKPVVYFPDAAYGNYNERAFDPMLKPVTTVTQLAVSWAPQISSLPEAITAQFSRKNSTASAHVIFDKTVPSELNNIIVELDDPAQNFKSRPFTVQIGAEKTNYSVMLFNYKNGNEVYRVECETETVTDPVTNEPVVRPKLVDGKLKPVIDTETNELKPDATIGTQIIKSSKAGGAEIRFSEVKVLEVNRDKVSADIKLDMTLNFDGLKARFYRCATTSGGVVGELNEQKYKLVEAGPDWVKLKVEYHKPSRWENNDAAFDERELIYAPFQRQFLDGQYSSLLVEDIEDSVNDNSVSKGSKQRVTAGLDYFKRFTAAMRGIYNASNPNSKKSGGAYIERPDIIYAFSFSHDGNEYTVDLSGMNPDSCDVFVESVDIREPGKVKNIGRLKTQGQYQLLKQQWNSTSDVENFWWIDRDHVLELNNRFFTLKRNTHKLHDWDGEIFEEVYKVKRSDIIAHNTHKVFATNVCGNQRSALLIVIGEGSAGAEVRVYSVRPSLRLVHKFVLMPWRVDLGKPLLPEGNILKLVDAESENSDFPTTTYALPTYSWLSTAMLLSKAEWTATSTNNLFILGCHASKNFDQWTIIFEYGAEGKLVKPRLIQGYGYVGVHGELTGGMLPAELFGLTNQPNQVSGFNGTVEPLSVLEVERKNQDNLDLENIVVMPEQINELEERVVGTTERQWYIKRKLHGIVSHLKLDGDNYSAEIIPLTNNYASIYKSPSFASSVLGDCMIQPQILAQAISFPSGLDVVWQMLLSLAGYPVIFSLAPRHSIICYLQQTFGQYAYVHYNSSMSPPEKDSFDDGKDSGIGGKNGRRVDPILSSEFTFGRQKVSQTVSSELNYFSTGLIGLLVSVLGQAVQTLDKKISINEEQGQVSAFDKGRKFVENVLDNTAGLMSSAIITQSKSDASATSTVCGVKSLDMFYSTSDMQRVFAGPGFVEHQFVADCVAQSVTDTQLEGKVTQFYMCIAAPTIFQMRMATFILRSTIDAMIDTAKVTDKYQICANNYGAAIASVMLAIAYGLMAVCRLQEFAVEEVTRMLDSLVSKGMTASVDGQVSRHAMSVEGKHKYGEKNEVFMWPCWGVYPGQLKYSDETVSCGVKNTPWALSLRSAKYFTSTPFSNRALSYEVPLMSSNFANIALFNGAFGGAIDDYNKAAETIGTQDPAALLIADNYRAARHEGNVPFYQAAPYGEVIERELPNDMAKIEGVARILSSEPFKNENIGVSDPAFAPSLIHDYIIDKDWDLGQCATYGIPQWVSVKDTKITNCPPSNIIVSNSFCGVACPYAAIEVKPLTRKAYMRPWAVTPNVLAFNMTGLNCVLDDRLYHAFDGQSCRIVDLVGTPGLNKNRQSFLYAFQRNDRFKRSNIIPANEMQGNFEAEPTLAMDCVDPLWVELTVASKEKGLSAGTIGEDKDAVRWSIPLFTEHVSTLPACVKTLTAATLAVVDGVTGLVTAKVTDTNSAYKAPTSVDFTIGKQVYRATEEYICSVNPVDGGNVVTDLIPSLGLKFIGSTPTEAYFYSQATRCYYLFTGSTLAKIDMMERFRDIQKGYWDFVNQEVVMPCLMTFKRLNPDVSDKDTETDNIIVPVLSRGSVSGELPVPLTTVFNDRSWYKCVSLPSGFAYQGPNRVIINRAVFVEYMLESMKDNLGKWGKLDKEKYGFARKYNKEYERVDRQIDNGVSGWTYNPFLLVTSALGLNENIDCLFEWTITFCWPIEMDMLYGQDNCAVVNICADTMTPGGRQTSRPTHVFLTKELFTRNGAYGYYSFRFQSKNGAGNRERLKIWSDQYIAISSLQCEYKVVTQRRTEILTQQQDVKGLKEL